MQRLGFSIYTVLYKVVLLVMYEFLDILYSASGTIKFGVDKASSSHKTFTQHFVLSMINEKWLVVSDTVRLSQSEYNKR